MCVSWGRNSCISPSRSSIWGHRVRRSVALRVHPIRNWLVTYTPLDDTLYIHILVTSGYSVGFHKHSRMWDAHPALFFAAAKHPGKLQMYCRCAGRWSVSWSNHWLAMNRFRMTFWSVCGESIKLNSLYLIYIYIYIICFFLAIGPNNLWNSTWNIVKYHCAWPILILSSSPHGGGTAGLDLMFGRWFLLIPSEIQWIPTFPMIQQKSLATKAIKNCWSLRCSMSTSPRSSPSLSRTSGWQDTFWGELSG